MDFNIEEMSLEELNELLEKIQAKLTALAEGEGAEDPDGGETGTDDGEAPEGGEADPENRDDDPENPDGGEADPAADDVVDQLSDDLDELEALIDQIEGRKAAIMAKTQKRSALIQKIASGEKGKLVRTAQKEENKMPKTINEIRKSPEYAKAYLRGLQTGDYKEARALLSTNTTGEGLTGYVPVPEFLETEIKTAWEEHKLISLVKHSNFKGNVKIGFELSATGATVHVEGTDAPTEEVITLGTVEIKAENIKKWITVSDEALEGTTVDTMGYLFKEIAHKIAEKAEEILIGLFDAAPTTSTSTAVAVKESTVGKIAVDTIVKAVALLSAQARDLNIAMNRQTYAEFMSAALNANYALDVFDGLKEKVVFTDKLPGFQDAATGKTFAVIGDFGYGAQANFPNGDDLSILTDNLSLAEKDLVKLVGRQYVGLALVAENAFVRLKKGNAA